MAVTCPVRIIRGGCAPVLDAHCHSLGEPIFDLMFEPADRSIFNAYALRKSVCLLHAGDGHAGVTDYRGGLPPSQYSGVHQYLGPVVFQGQRNRNENALAGVGLNKKIAQTHVNTLDWTRKSKNEEFDEL